jgi:hypothetical protein
MRDELVDDFIIAAKAELAVVDALLGPEDDRAH